MGRKTHGFLPILIQVAPLHKAAEFFRGNWNREILMDLTFYTPCVFLGRLFRD